eukprot:scaffold135708_cov33-Tisochrysis_lutea.AAC.2
MGWAQRTRVAVSPSRRAGPARASSSPESSLKTGSKMRLCCRRPPIAVALCHGRRNEYERCCLEESPSCVCRRLCRAEIVRIPTASMLPICTTATPSGRIAAPGPAAARGSA